jgi:Outer membrane protein beta-barrel domain
MHNLLRKQIIVSILLAFISLGANAQKEMFRNYHDDLPYYFGLSLGYNTSFFAAKKAEKFLQDDSILSAEPRGSGGISIGLHATLKLSKRWQLRFNPQIVLGGARYFDYTLKPLQIGEPIGEEHQTLPTTLLSFPVHFKFNSDRINNFRTYLLLGAKMDIDLSASSTERNKDNYLRLKPYTYGAEVGIGFNLFLRYFTLTPELKIGYGLNNILDRDPNLKFSSVFNSLQSRMIMINLIFED